MKTQADEYFVRLDQAPAPAPQRDRRGRGAASGPVYARDRRKRRLRIRPSVVLLVALVSWFAWASQQPGGVSGTVNGWIDHTRGEVAKVSADPDMHRGVVYFNQQYPAAHAYPRLSEDQVATLVGMGVQVQWCSAHAVVLQGSVGGGTVSRLLLDGRDLGTVNGSSGCPSRLDDPAPWKG